MTTKRQARWLGAVAGTAVTLWNTSLSFAQGCAMCYTNAAAAGPGARQALRSGILILLIPPLAMLAGMMVWTYLRRNESVIDARNGSSKNAARYP